MNAVPQDRRFRILQVHTRYRQRGGEDVVVEREAELLRSAGHEVFQLIAENPRSTLPATAALMASPWNPVQAYRTTRLARELRPDVAHVHNTWFALSPSVVTALHRLGIPVVMTIHNYRLACANGMLYRDGTVCEECLGGSPWPAVRHRCYRGSAAASLPASATIALNQGIGTWHRGISIFVALTAFQRRKLVEAGFPSGRIVVKPNPIPDPGPRRSPPSESRTVLFVGRLAPEKGIERLLEAWSGMRNLKLSVIGDGPLYVTLKARFPSATFLGTIPHSGVRRCMANARALVFPSDWYETFGNVVVEAFSFGLPVLAPAVGAAAELVKPLGPRWIYASADSLASSVFLLRDDKEVARAGKKAREVYEQHYTPELATRNLERVYARAILVETAPRSENGQEPGRSRGRGI